MHCLADNGFTCTYHLIHPGDAMGRSFEITAPSRSLVTNTEGSIGILPQADRPAGVVPLTALSVEWDWTLPPLYEAADANGDPDGSLTQGENGGMTGAHRAGHLSGVDDARRLGSGLREPGSGAALAYRPSDLVRAIRTLEGQRVRVVGHLSLGREARALWDSRENLEDARRKHASAGDPVWNHCVTAYYDFDVAREIERAAGTDVQAIATVETSHDGDGSVDLWACNDVYITIHRMDPVGRTNLATARARASARRSMATSPPTAAVVVDPQ